MKTLKDCYTIPLPTPDELLRWSDSIKVGESQSFGDSPSTAFVRIAEGVFSVIHRRETVGTVRLKKPGATVAWAGVASVKREAVEPVLEPVEPGNHVQIEALQNCLAQFVALAHAQLALEERRRFKAGLAARSDMVKTLKHKANILGAKDGADYRRQARQVAKFTEVLEVSGFRIAVWRDKGALHACEFYTGQGFAVNSIETKGFDGKKKELMDLMKNQIAHRIAEVGPKQLLEILNASPVINGGEL